MSATIGRFHCRTLSDSASFRRADFIVVLVTPSERCFQDSGEEVPNDGIVLANTFSGWHSDRSGEWSEDRATSIAVSENVQYSSSTPFDVILDGIGSLTVIQKGHN